MDTAIAIILAGGLTGSLLLIVALAESGYGRRSRSGPNEPEHPPEDKRESEARVMLEL